jgi:hypothetical protein
VKNFINYLWSPPPSSSEKKLIHFIQGIDPRFPPRFPMFLMSKYHKSILRSRYRYRF